MKKLISLTVLGLFLFNASNVKISQAYESSFPDVEEDDRYLFTIEYLHALNIFQGSQGADGDYYMEPDSSINRAEFVTVIVRAETEPDPAVYKNCFEDVGTEWFAPYVCYAKEKGWVSGQGDGTRFEPTWNVNLAEASKIIAENQDYADSDSVVSVELPYEDLDSSHWSYSYVGIAYEKNLLEASGEDLGLGESQTRGQVAEFLARAVMTSATETEVYSSEVFAEAMEAVGLGDYVNGHQIYLAQTYTVDGDALVSDDYYPVAGQFFSADSYGNGLLAISESYELSGDTVRVDDYSFASEFVLPENAEDDVYLFLVNDDRSVPGNEDDGGNTNEGDDDDDDNNDNDPIDNDGEEEPVSLSECLAVYSSFTAYEVYDGSTYQCSLENYTLTYNLRQHTESYSTAGSADLSVYAYFEEDTEEWLEESVFTVDFMRLQVSSYDQLGKEYDVIFDQLLVNTLDIEGEYSHNRLFEERETAYDYDLEEEVVSISYLQEQGPYEDFSFSKDFTSKEDYERKIAIAVNGYFSDLNMNSLTTSNELTVDGVQTTVYTDYSNDEKTYESSEEDLIDVTFGQYSVVDFTTTLGSQGWDGSHGVSGEEEFVYGDGDPQNHNTYTITWSIN